MVVETVYFQGSRSLVDVLVERVEQEFRKQFSNCIFTIGGKKQPVADLWMRRLDRPEKRLLHTHSLTLP